MNRVCIKYRKSPHARDIPSPQYMTEGSSGMDLYAAIDKQITIEPGQTCLVDTGVQIAIPEGYEGQIRPRSGLALKYGITVLNSPGTIDSDYRGEIKIILINLGKEPYIIKRGERIAQIVFQSITKASLEEVEDLPCTERGDGGFGHTGK